MSKKTYEVTLQEDPNDPEGAILQFPDEVIESTGWKEGDMLSWSLQPDGSVLLSKTETE